MKGAQKSDLVSQPVELRSEIRHSRDVNQIARKEGEAAIMWFHQVLLK